MAQKCILKRFGFTGLAAIIVGRLSRYLNSPYRSENGKGDGRKSMGDYGERVAADFLRTNGCRILGRNFKGRRGGEVDLVAREAELLLFVEVKTRRAGARVRGFDAVGKEKQMLIERGANEWLRRLGTRQLPWRFDVIEVEVEDGEVPKIRWIQDAF